MFCHPDFDDHEQVTFASDAGSGLRAIVALHRERAVTVVFVTHDLQEALAVGERIIHFDAGRIVADMTRDEYIRSSEPVVKRFVESAMVHAAV